MVTVTVSLPDAMRDWVETQTRDGGYTEPSDYVRELIRRDQERSRTLSEFDRLIDEGLASGISRRTPDEITALARAQATATLARDV